MRREVGKLNFTWFPEQRPGGSGGFTIHGLNYDPDRTLPNATATLTTFGDLNLHDFSQEQLQALSEVAAAMSAYAKSEPAVDAEPEEEGP